MSIRRLFHQSSHYFTGNIIVVLAGLISYPVWTRYFSAEDYGVLSLLNVTIFFMIVVSKLGLPQSALRFYSEFKEGKRGGAMEGYYTSMLIGAAGISLAVTLLLFLVVRVFFSSMMDARVMALLPLVAFIVLIGAVNSILIEFLRAEQKSGFYSVIQVASRYGQLGFSVLFVFVFFGNLTGFFVGMAVSGCLVLASLLFALIYRKRVRIREFSTAFLGESVRYGFPLIWFELSNVILSMGDRYLIQYYLGSKSVGVYSAGYALAEMAQSSISMPLKLAVLPMYLSLWDREGMEKTSAFLSQALNYYFMMGIPIVVGLSWFGKDIITLLASAKYEEASVIIPYVVFPLVLHGAFVIFGAGIYIRKKTSVLMYLTLFAGALNIALNIALIPAFGMLGAAYSTLISYTALVALIIASAYRHLSVRVRFLPIIKYTLLSIAAALMITWLPSSGISQMIIKMSSGILLYAAALLALDGDLRSKTFGLLRARH